MKTVLVVSGGGFQGLALVQALQRLTGIRVIVCDIHAENPVRYVCQDYIVSPPLADEDAFAGFLLDVVARERVCAVFPATAYELVTLSRLKRRLATEGALVAVSDEGLLTKLLDKLGAHEWLRTAGLPVPEMHDPLAFDFRRPLFGRPRHGWGGRGTTILHSLEEARDSRVDLQACIWTEWLGDFEEYSADFAIDTHGNVSPIALRKRLRASGGFAVVSESVADASLEDIAGRAALALGRAGGQGLFNVQILRPLHGAPFISDVNPRIGTSSTHAMAEGLNLPGFFLAEGRPAAHASPDRKMVKSARILKDIIVPRLARAPAGVVFDLDDTLVDHKLWMLRKIEAIYPEVFSGRVDMTSFLLCAARLIDEGERARLIDRVLADLSLPATLQDEAIEAYRSATVPDTPLFSDVAPLLLRLKAAGMATAILTDNPPATQRDKISHAPALQGVDAVVYAREHGGEKPHAAGFLQAADMLSMEPGQLVMIGDNYFRDGVGAVQAGYMHALIVRRDGIFLSPHAGIASHLAAAVPRIDMVDSLSSAGHACLQS
jgi:FMN phosphatase YigB (HAD superfamily)